MATDEKRIRDAVKEWNARARAKDSDAEKIDVRRVDAARATVKLEYIDESKHRFFSLSSFSLSEKKKKKS